ncbi:P-loop containing nucleoside triphosphate hydrolase protein [Russula compacta]|nr:P-loop containing nucleoside triphosphate hydrolase protein [Russula compacta]
MIDEVKQYKEEWGVVMDKLKSIAVLMVDFVRVSAEEHGLEEKDLPRGLLSIFDSLKTELHGIKGMLEQIGEIRCFKKILLRKDLLQKVKQYDGKLSNVLDRFNAAIALDTRFAQLAEVKVTRGAQSGPSGSSDIAISMPQGPCSPQIFFGRDSELEAVVHMIFANLSSRPARTAILGPPGYGKTTLANAVLTDERVQEHFGKARYFVACESVFSSGALLTELAKILGLLDGATTDASWPRIHSALDKEDCIICFDNFESPWDQDGDTRCSVEKLLSRVTELRRTTVLITMRGIMRPDQTQWTKPFLPPLVTLDRDAAKRIWECSADNYDLYAEELITAVDYVPLAINLLAHLAQATSPESLLKEWNEKHTEFIQTCQPIGS